MTRSSAKSKPGWARFLPAARALFFTFLVLSPGGASAAAPAAPADSAGSAVSAPLPAPRAEPLSLWVELEKNQARLSSPAAIAALVDSAAEAGFRQIIVELKRSDGAVAFPSSHAPSAGLKFDYYGAFKKAADRRGLKTVVHLRVFVEGNTKTEKGPAYDRPAWQTIVKAEDQETLQIQSQYSRRGPVLFANPCLPEVQQYESLVIEDLLRGLKPEAVLLEDLRFFAVESDVGDSTRVRFERWSGLPSKNWPAEVLDDKNARYPMWQSFRVGVIREFAGRIRALRDRLAPDTRLLLGAPGYYEGAVSIGVNWAHADYKPGLWYADARFQRSGLAGLFDGIVLLNRDSNPLIIKEVILAVKTATRNQVPVAILLTSDLYPRRAGRFRECLQVIRDAGLGVVVSGIAQLGPQGLWEIVKEEMPAGR